MIRRLAALAAALAFALATFAPTSADARDRRGYQSRHYDGAYDRHRWRDRHDHDGDALAAGVVGLVLGLAIGSAASQPRRRDDGCYDNYQRCPPPRGYYDRGYEEGYYDPRYDDDRRSAYERDYEGYYEEERCVRRERQWDRYARRYVTVDVPC